MAFRFAPKPVVSAPHGQTLGGGLEVCLHSDRIVAAGETYMGLVEVGVGLIPAGGGTKEMARRLLPAAPRRPRHPAATLPPESLRTDSPGQDRDQRPRSKGDGLPHRNDRIVMNADHLISAAKREVMDLADGYTPPEHANNVYASGRSAGPHWRWA